MAKITAMYKSELRRLAGASDKDFLKWLNMPRHKKALAGMGVKPTAHKLPPKAVQYVIDNYGIILE